MIYDDSEEYYEEKRIYIIELLAVIIILAMIALIAAPRVIELVDKAKESSFERQKEFILNAAKMYTFKNPNVKDLGYVTLRELIDNNYIESGIKDNKGNVLDDIYIVNLESNHVITTTKNEGEVISINNSIGLPLSKLIINGKSDQTIPNGYTFYDYISLSGTQYIDSAVIPNNNTSIFIDCKSTISGRWIFGSRQGPSSTDRFGLYIDTNVNMFPQYDSQGISTINITNTLLRTKHKLSKNTYWVNGTKLHTFTERNFNGKNTIYIGAMNQTSVDPRIFSGEIYQVKIWQDTTLIRNYIPSVRTSDNVVGLYDLVNGVFYTNKGKGVFTIGSEIILPSPDTPIEIKNVSDFNLISTDGENESVYNFPYVLRSLNNGVKDYIEIDNVGKTAKLYKNIGEKIFDGTETWAFESSSARFYTWVEAKKSRESLASLAPISSTHFKTVGNKNDNDLTMREGGNKNVMFKYSALGNNVSSFKSWLADQHTKETPLKIQYELETPEVINLDYDKYSNIVTYKGFTNIYKTGIKSNMEMEIFINE